MPGIDLVFNDVSMQSIVSSTDLAQARSLMTRFIATISQASQRGFNKVLRIPGNFYTMELTTGYTFSDWRHDSDVDSMQRLYLAALTQKAPYLADIDIPDQYHLIEVQYEKKAEESFRVAFAFSWLLVSVFTDAKWDTSNLSARLVEYMDNESIREKNVSVNHASRKSHINLLNSWFVQRIFSEITTTTELWEKRQTLFPDIEFAPRTKYHIEALGLKTPQLTQIIERLSELNVYCRDWTSGAFQIKKLQNCSVETQNTLMMYSAQREFYSERNERLLLNYHLRITPNAGRIYFDLIPGRHSICIGHIGGKLPTSKHP